jgi:hypothetical protein
MGSVAAACGLIVSAFVSASAAGAAPKGGGLPPGLQFNPVNMTNNNNLRYGEPEVAVNPRNPNNIVYHVMSQQLTYACEAVNDPNCINDPLSGAAVGEDTTPGWLSTHVYVSSDRGRSWTDVTSNLDHNSIPAPTVVTDSTGTHLVSHTDLLSRGDPMVTVTADGTFYIGWDAMHLGQFQETFPPGFTFGGRLICPGPTPCTFTVNGLVDGGIAVSKSTDGGRTWSTPTLTGTGVDRPWMTTDLSTGRIYEASSGSINSSMSTGDPALPQFSAAPSDRYVVSSTDGVNWTQPEPLGGSGSNISAANGVLAAGFHVAADNGTNHSNAACQFFLSNPAAIAPCTVFETSTDTGAHWSRHSVPGLANASGSILVAADPAVPGTYTLASTDPTTTQFQVVVTHDSGADWSGPTIVTDGSAHCPSVSLSACKFKPWINYSPDGVLGLAWRSANVASNSGTSASVAAVRPAAVLTSSADVAPAGATDTGGQPLCDPLGCGVAPPDDENDLDPAPVPYTIWAAVSRDAGATFSQPLQVSAGASAPADPNMLTGTDDTSVIALSDSDVLVGWGQWALPSVTMVGPDQSAPESWVTTTWNCVVVGSVAASV